MKIKVSLGIITGLSLAAIAATAITSNRNVIGLRADPDPVVTLTTLVYDEFSFEKIESRDFWITSPNGNKIGIHLGGNYAITSGKLLLEASEEAYVITNEVAADSSARKYAFSEIKSINVSFTTSGATSYLKTQYRSGGYIVDGYLSNNSDLNLDNSDFFKLYPSSGTVNITSIRVTYNSTGDFCN